MWSIETLTASWLTQLASLQTKSSIWGIIGNSSNGHIIETDQWESNVAYIATRKKLLFGYLPGAVIYQLEDLATAEQNWRSVC